ncbi:MAG: single-stranded-DNA-specific exonuclease RecJ [Lachnospiraceae bacterium]|nr:single-stranded-DNA-specific exonuclease RecJ [Lachnospiraceae bacterium]
MREKWILENKKADFRGLAQKVGVSPLLIKLAINRGARSEEAIREYFFGSRQSMYDPELMKDAKKAAGLILENIRRGGRTGIASDFDVDGIFSALILYRSICRLGGRAKIYTPDRVAEGYGLNMRIVAEAKDDDVSLLLTCDNGIAAPEPVAWAREQGMITVVTDHHEVPFTEEDGGKRQYHLPPAHAVVNPRRTDCSYPWKGLCGAGVAYKVVQLLYREAGIPEKELDEFLAYAAMATVADVMDLTGENRIIVRFGLRPLAETGNVGLKALMAVTGVDPAGLSSYHIGFVLGPCFNAAGRLATVRQAFALLLAGTMEEAMPIALELKELNESRKNMTTDGVEEGKRLIEEKELYRLPVIVVRLSCHESLAGIIAGRLRETYGHPVYVITNGETGLKGSGRSIEAYSMFEHLQRCGDLLTRFGGHPMAAGLSLPEENFDSFVRRINEDTGLVEEDFHPVVRIDAAVPISMLSEEGIGELELLEPTGKANRKPLFAEQHFALRSGRIMGKNRNVLKLQVQNSEGCVMDALFYDDIETFEKYVEQEFGTGAMEAVYRGQPNPVDLGFVYYPSVNEYRGARTLQIVIKHYCRIARS